MALTNFSNIVNEDGTYLLEFFTDMARQNLPEDDPLLNTIIFNLGTTLQNNSYHQRAIRVMKEL